jgi:acyl-CoA synthetase (AMP-forming)/AMP-acid ligase II
MRKAGHRAAAAGPARVPFSPEASTPRFDLGHFRQAPASGRSPDAAAGEIPVALIALREGFARGKMMERELCGFVAERLTHYKQPREVHFVEVVPKTASGKILRRELRQLIR